MSIYFEIQNVKSLQQLEHAETVIGFIRILSSENLRYFYLNFKFSCLIKKKVWKEYKFQIK